MKIGLFFGSFNPIHVGHLAVAQHMASKTDLDCVWLVVSPHNPLKEKSVLADKTLRLKQAKKAVRKFSNIKVCNVEFSLPQPSYTITTLRELKNKYPQHEFVIIMGEDNIHTFRKWKKYKEILEKHALYVYPRKSSTKNKIKKNLLYRHKNVHVVKAPLINISSTYIRAQQNKGKDVSKALA